MKRVKRIFKQGLFDVYVQQVKYMPMTKVEQDKVIAVQKKAFGLDEPKGMKK